MVCLCLALPAMGQSWAAQTGDDGASYYGGAAYRSGPHIVDVFCAGRSPQNLPFPADHPGEYEVSSPGLLKIRIDHTSLPWLDTFDSATQSGVVWVVGTTGYQLPVMQPDALWGGLAIELQPMDALFQGIASGQPMELRFPGGQTIPLAPVGVGQAMAQMQAFCAPYLGAAQPTPAPVDLVAAAHAEIFRVCEGQATAEQGYMSKGDLDGDGLDDVLVSYQDITCPGGRRPPICGASLCSHHVYLSRTWRPGAEPHDLLGMSSGIMQRPGGGLMVRTSGNFSLCGNAPTACFFDWGWTGTQFEELR